MEEQTRSDYCNLPNSWIFPSIIQVSLKISSLHPKLTFRFIRIIKFQGRRGSCRYSWIGPWALHQWATTSRKISRCLSHSGSRARFINNHYGGEKHQHDSSSARFDCLSQELKRIPKSSYLNRENVKTMSLSEEAQIHLAKFRWGSSPLQWFLK